MADIYRRAVEVQVWLCEEDEVIPREPLDTSELALHPFDPELFNNWLKDGNLSKFLLPLEATGGALSLPTITYALDILRLFAEGKHRHEMPFLHITTSLKTEPSPTWHKVLHVISLMFSRPRWKRLWIVQEVVVAASATAQIGVYEVPISLFIDASDGYYQHFPCCSTGSLQPVVVRIS